VDGLKSVYLDDTPVQNPDGSYNFKNLVVTQRFGLPQQPYVPGYEAASAPTPVGIKVRKDTPVTRSVTNLQATALRVTARVPALYEQKDGAARPTQVEYTFEVQPNGGLFTEAVHETLSGKTTSPYDKQYRIELTGTGPWLIRMKRITADNDGDANLQNDVYFASFDTIIDHKFSYPYTAYFGIEMDSQSTGGNIPTRKYLCNGLEDVKIPSNYDPETREYTGIWDGTFKTDFTNNPAWLTYKVLTDPRWGLGRILGIASESTIDKWLFYDIAQRCDELVPDGNGGMEPRYRMAFQLTTQEDALALVQGMAAAFDALAYWSAGSIALVQDRPEDPIDGILISPGNVKDGDISYSGQPYKSLHSVAVVTWYNPELNFQPDYEPVQDPDLIRELGMKTIPVIAIGCTSRGQAIRAGRRILETEKSSEDNATYTAGFDHAAYSPGRTIIIRDPSREGVKLGGRIKAFVLDGTDVVGAVLDKEIQINSNESPYLYITTNDLKLVIKQLTNDDELTDTVMFDSPLTEEVQVGNMFGFASNVATPRLFRGLAVKESAPNQWTVQAVARDPNMWTRIETGVRIVTPQFTAFPTGPIGTPSGIQVLETIALEGITPTQVVYVSFTPPADPRVILYETQFLPPNGNWQGSKRTSDVTADYASLGAIDVSFRVRSIDRFGRYSQWVESAPVSLQGLLGRPSDVQNFKIQVLGNTATLSWDAVPDLNFAYYEIRYTPDIQGGQFASSTLLLTNLTGNSVQIPALAGTYFIKAITTAGVPSANAAVVISTVSSVDLLNSVLVEQEDPEWNGIKVGTIVDETGALRLDNSDEIGDWPHLEDVFERAYGYGGGVFVGTYQLAKPIDLTEIYSSQVTVLIKADGSNDLDAMINWNPLSSVLALSDVDPSEWSVLLEYRTTNDAPFLDEEETILNPDAVWSDWAEFHTATYTARAYDFRLTLRSYRLGVTPRIINYKITIDMPDRVDGKNNVAVPAGGVRIVFDPKFKQLDGVGIQTEDFLSGDQYTVTDKDATGFFISIVDANGDPVARHISYVAKGFGKLAVST
jgi:predicted phage tail protein